MKYKNLSFSTIFTAIIALNGNAYAGGFFDAYDKKADESVTTNKTPAVAPAKPVFAPTVKTFPAVAPVVLSNEDKQNFYAKDDLTLALELIKGSEFIEVGQLQVFTEKYWKSFTPSSEVNAQRLNMERLYRNAFTDKVNAVLNSSNSANSIVEKRDSDFKAFRELSKFVGKVPTIRFKELTPGFVVTATEPYYKDTIRNAMINVINAYQQDEFSAFNTVKSEPGFNVVQAQVQASKRVEEINKLSKQVGYFKIKECTCYQREIDNQKAMAEADRQQKEQEQKLKAEQEAQQAMEIKEQEQKAKELAETEPVPVPVVATVKQEKPIISALDSLTAKAETAFKANRLSTPKGDNVLEVVDEMNTKGFTEQASFWKRRVADKYISFGFSAVKRASNVDQLKKPKRYAKLGDSLGGNANALTSEITKKEQSFVKPVKVVKAEPKTQNQNTTKPVQKKEEESELKKQSEKFVGSVKSFWNDLSTGNVEVDKSGDDVLGIE